MSDLLIRDVPLHVKQHLQARAQKHGRSLSAEASLLLQEALLGPDVPDQSEFWTRIRKSLPEDCRVDEDFVPLRDLGERPLPDFS